MKRPSLKGEDREKRQPSQKQKPDCTPCTWWPGLRPTPSTRGGREGGREDLRCRAVGFPETNRCPGKKYLFIYLIFFANGACKGRAQQVRSSHPSWVSFSLLSVWFCLVDLSHKTQERAAETRPQGQQSPLPRRVPQRESLSEPRGASVLYTTLPGSLRS